MCKIAQYASLEKWAADNNVSFNVRHYDDCHILSVVWHLGRTGSADQSEAPDAPVVWGLVKYPHAGGKYDILPWGNRGKVREFVELFDAMRKKAPIQPTKEVGATLE